MILTRGISVNLECAGGLMKAMLFASQKIANRKYLKKKLDIKKIIYTNQTHSTKIIEHYKNPFALQGDGMILKSKIGYCVTTADCLPILFCSTDGNYFGGIHCGRRGLINGIIENLLEIIKNEI